MSSAVDSTPVSLLVRLRQPEATEAWTRFVHLFAPLMDRWARTQGLQDADAADVVQEVFCVLVKRLPHFVYDPQRSFRAWLWTIVRNSCRNHLQRRKDAFQPLETSGAFAAADGLQEITDAEYRHYLVGRALQIMQADFAPATWKAFWGVVVEGRTGADVARELGVTVNAVYLSRSRVLSRLRRELAGLDV